MSRKGANSHEVFVEHSEVKGPSNRSFGLTVGGILCAIALFRWYWKGAAGWDAVALLAAGVPLVLFALLAPRLLTRSNELWMKLGALLARVVNPIIMFAMFVIMFVPVALIMRALGRDSLRRTRDPVAKSYWIVRNPPGPPRDGIVNQY